jgi:putative endonuclease
VVVRNWRCATGEIDLVVRRGTELVVAEVKARLDDRFGPAASAVGDRKQRTIRRVAAQFLAESGLRGSVRFDVVSVTGARVEVIAGAF